MAAVGVKLGEVGTQWTAASKLAIADLNQLFRRKGIGVTLALNGHGPQIEVITDASIQGHLVHGKTSQEADGAGRLIKATVRLPVKLTINTPQGSREAGVGMHEVVAAHEFLHALGHAPHNSHLMGQTLDKVMNDRAAKDKLKAGSVAMPPLQLSDDTVEILKGLWP